MRGNKSAGKPAGGLLPLLLAAGCGADTPPPDIVDLQRPSDIAFACFGDLRVTEGQPADPTQPVVASAQPVSSCRAWFDGGRPAGQEDLEGEGVFNPLAPSFVNFVLEPAKGTLAVVMYEASSTGLTAVGVVDTDPLTPGRNPIPVGTLPVSVAASADGCTMVTANAGSCDLSVVAVDSVVAFGATPQVDRVQLRTPGGARVLARPADLVAGPPAGEPGFTCPDTAQGVMWVAYPDCHAVAAVSVADGAVLSSIRFAADGTATVGDGELACLDECGEGAVSARHDTTTPRPVALHVNADGSRLYIGAQNRPELTVVDLDAGLLPTAVGQVVVEGAVGLHKLIETGPVTMGGATGFLGAGDGPVMEFVYAIASDNTIRVVEVSGATADTWRECDTQIDPRALHDVTDVALLSCLPIGDADFPRRLTARSPGIHIPRISALTTTDYAGIPLDLSVTTVERPDDVDAESGRACVRLSTLTDDLAPSPYCMVGTFVFVSTGDGQVFVINVDDDVYPDFEDEFDPALVTMPLAVAHQLRDWVSNRDDADGIRSSDLATGATNPDPPVACLTGTSADNAGARLVDDVDRIFRSDVLAAEKAHLLPNVRAGLCTPTSGTTDRVVFELGYGAPVDQRESAFPDVHAVRNEDWTATWEGVVSLDPPDRVVDGPPTRVGFISPAGNASTFLLEDDGAPFCRAGVEAFDIVALTGCDPTRGDSQCGIGETCFVHPDTPASISSGMCLPAGDADALATTCRGLLTSRRRYSISGTVLDDQLRVIERRRVLTTTPPEGCTDVPHCEALWERQRALAEPDHPGSESLEPPDRTLTFECAPDPTRGPAAGTPPNRCMMVCESDDQCEEGSVCSTSGMSAGYCVEGPLPSFRCVDALQRYQLRVGDAFTVLGETTGFLHNRVRDDATGECIDSPSSNPLAIGRLPLVAEPCAAAPTDPSPNPCMTSVEHSDEVALYELQNDVCVLGVGTEFRTRTVDAIRFENPAIRFHMVEPVTTGDAVCLGDGAGTGLRYATVHPGMQLRMPLTGGMMPVFVSWDQVRNLVVRYPAVLASAPDGGMWVLDQGDRSFATQGQILRIDPTAAPEGFAVVVASAGR